MINANDPKLESWLKIEKDSDFPLQNIPFGIFKNKSKDARPGTRIGDWVIDLASLTDFQFFDKFDLEDLKPFYKKTLNDFIAKGKDHTNKIRNRIAEIFEINNAELKNNELARDLTIFHVRDVEMLMPVEVGDYTDFYSSIEHATNVGKMFRDPENALLPNWKHIPVAYHGRSSSIVVSGTPIHRPKGQTKADDQEKPIFGPSRLMDFELEMAFITGKKTQLGESISVDEAEEYIFGLVIFNDLSARDIQKWEYVPLGPFLGKNFGSVISPWIVTLDALHPFKTTGPAQEPEVLDYLKKEGNQNLDIELEVWIQPENGVANKVSQSNMKYLYWSMSQQLAHHTVNGCNINVGDMCASGTISGPTPDSYGSMLELSWKGTKSLKLDDGIERKFLQDGDTIIMNAFAKNQNRRIGFGKSVTKILPST